MKDCCSPTEDDMSKTAEADCCNHTQESPKKQEKPQGERHGGCGCGC